MTQLFHHPDGWVAALARYVIAGCAAHKLQRAVGAGSSTFDQAKGELGPPGKEAQLAAGARVPDWLTR